MARPLVFFSHDGGVDDYLSIMLLMAMDQVEVIGISVTPADCYIQSAVSATRKILDLMGRDDVPVAESTVRGLNPFPRQFRRDSISIDLFPILNERDSIRAPMAGEDGQHFVARQVRQAPAPVTFLETGPLTTLAAALDMDPGLESKIERLVWMGGALEAAGNVDPYIEGLQDMTAEWNVYWDPFAADRVWKTRIPIVLCPLDITNNVEIKPDFIRRLARQRRHPVSDLAGMCYALVAHQPYYCWDVLATAYVGRPDLFGLRVWETEIVTTGPGQGRTKVCPGGRMVTALDTVDKSAFFEYILKQWAR